MIIEEQIEILKENKYFLIDLDGTLYNDKDRVYLVKGKKRNYEEYHARSIEDMYNVTVLELIKKKVEEGYIPLYVTGRTEVFREITNVWFEKFNIPKGFIYMKPEEIRGIPAELYKVNTLKILGLLDKIHIVIDNNLKVLEELKKNCLNLKSIMMVVNNSIIVEL